MNLSDVRILQLEPTSYCNARCPHCPRFDSSGNLHPDLTLDHIDVAQLVANLELHKLTSLQHVHIEGDRGDPLMHPAIEQLIDAFCTMPNPPMVELVTNGSIRNNTWWRKLANKNYPTLRVNFSIDGLEDTNHLYRVGIDYRTIVSNVQAFVDAGGRAIWKMLVFRHNEHQVEQVQKFALDLGVEEFRCFHSDKSRFQDQPQWPVTVDGVTHYIQPAENNYNILRTAVPVEIAHLVVENQYICPNLNYGHLYVNYQGYVVPCCMMHADTQLNYPGKFQLAQLSQGINKQNVNLHTLEKILTQAPFFTHTLEQSFKDRKFHVTCAKSCTPQILQNLKKYEIQTKNSVYADSKDIC